VKKLCSADRLHDLNDSRSLLNVVRCVIALSVATALLNVTMIAAAVLPHSESSMGIINIVGVVKINGQNAMSGQTVFSNSRVLTGANSESLIEYGNLARLKLEAESDLIVDASRQRIAGSLQKGRMLGSVPAGVSLDFQTANFSIATDAGRPVTFSVRTQECEGTSLSVSEGTVEVRTGDKVRTLKAGDNFSTFVDATTTQGSQQNFSHRKRVGLIIGISAAVTILLIALVGRDHEAAAPGGCIDILSGQSTCR
jgi:hypothetical protein